MAQTSDKKRIAKNTLMLYVRMLFVMAVTIYTSRIILEKLGVTDFGIYSSVAAVVAMLGFLNNTLSTGTSRFLTFELGKKNEQRTRDTFSTAFYTHLILALIVVTLLLAGGPWFISHKLIIPQESIASAKIVFYLSAFTTFIVITQVPYTSAIIAHENMKIYAYVGVFEAVAKLGIAYAISLAPDSKLVFYAILVAAVQFSVAMAYRIYSIKNYEETKLTRVFDKTIFKKMMSFSSWNLIANIAEILGHQGLVVIINMFFVPAIAAAQAVGAQISSAMMQFINNFRTAINPQIIKLYAAGEYQESQKLTLETTIYVFDLVLMLGLPLIVVMNPLIHVWLTDVPPYAVVFSQFIVVRNILGVFNGSWYTPMVASGQLKYNSVASIFLGIGEYIILYFLLKIGYSVIWVQYLAVAQILLFSFYVKPYVLCRQIDYRFVDLMKCVFRCVITAIIPVLFSVFLYYYCNINEHTNFLEVCLIILSIVIVVGMSSYLFLDKDTKDNINKFIIKKIKH